MSNFHIYKVTAEDLMSGMITSVITDAVQVQIPLTDDHAAILRCTLRAPKITHVDQTYYVKSQDSFTLYLNGGWKSSVSIVKPITYTVSDTMDEKEAYIKLLPRFYQYEANQVNQMAHDNEIEIFKACIDNMVGGKKCGRIC